MPRTRFLKEGHKVKFTVMFKGREITHQHIGRELLETIKELLADDAKVDQEIRMEGRNMSVLFTPDRPLQQAGDDGVRSIIGPSLLL